MMDTHYLHREVIAFKKYLEYIFLFTKYLEYFKYTIHMVLCYRTSKIE